jgi:hypothetical protein
MANRREFLWKAAATVGFGELGAIGTGTRLAGAARADVVCQLVARTKAGTAR